MESKKKKKKNSYVSSGTLRKKNSFKRDKIVKTDIPSQGLIRFVLKLEGAQSYFPITNAFLINIKLHKFHDVLHLLFKYK
jgi:hypothetical protein